MKHISGSLLRAAVSVFLAASSLFSNNPHPNSICPAPGGIVLNLVSSVSAQFSWHGAAPGATYEWEIGLPGFTPGNNEFVFRRATLDTLDIADGLASSTTFELYVRAVCSPGEQSAWSGPVSFTTAPGCGGDFYDAGGPLSPYDNLAMDTVLLCPASDSEVVQITFLAFETELNQDFLKIYDGTESSAPQLVSLSGTYLAGLDSMPGPFAASNATGCLLTLFFSNGQNTDNGWLAFVDCIAPDSCYGAANLKVDSIGTDSAIVTWTGLFGAGLFEWQLGVAPFMPGDPPLQSDTTSADTLILGNLASNTNYVLYVRGLCDSTAVSDWTSVTFSTPVACGDTLFDSGGPNGPYGPGENFTKTICPDSAQHTVTLTFLGFDTEAGKDSLWVYEGTSTQAPLAGAFSGAAVPPPITAHNATGCLTVQFVSDSTTQAAGWAAEAGCDTASTCFSLLDLHLIFVKKDSASIAWTPIFGAQGYIWELDTMPFTPGTGQALLSGTVQTSALDLDSLKSGQTYFLYVKTTCAADTSGWFGPLQFATPPGCGDTFYDSGGQGSNYGNNENYQTVICPDSAGQVVTLTFANFASAPGDSLQVYNSDSLNQLLLLATLGGSPTGPDLGPFSATTADGCLTLQFHSDTSGVDTGWVASVSCGPPSVCNEVLLLQVDSVNGTTVGISWLAMAGAGVYEWSVGEAPFAPGMGAAIDSGTTSLPMLVLNLPKSFTTYELYVRSLCKNDSSGWQKISFTTTVNCFTTGNDVFCGATAFTAASAGGPGAWDLNCGALPTLGQEQVFVFTPPATRPFRLVVGNVSGGDASFFYKPASDGCDNLKWNCIGSSKGQDTFAFGPLTAGVPYLILLDPETIDSLSAEFKIIDCAPLNDSTDGVITLVVNDPCQNNIHSNDAAGSDSGEPDPDTETDLTDVLAGRWLLPATKTLWFKFAAPASGTVTVRTETQQPAGGDTQLALYAVQDSSNYATFSYIESDDDNGATGGLDAELFYTGLTAGETYFIQADGALSGTFCIEVLDGVERFNTGTCAETYHVTGVDGTQPGGDRWYGIYAGQNASDLGRLVVAVKPGAQQLDSVFCRLTVYDDTIPSASNGVPYMPAYFHLRSSVQPVAPVSVRLFFYNYELDALKLKTGLPANTAADLNVSQYIGATPDCSPAGHSGSDVLLLDTVVQAVPTPGTASFYLEFTTPLAKLGEFGAHFGQIALPLELRSFRGTVRTADNLLEWITATETNVRAHVLERSPDGQHWAETGRLAGQMLSRQPLHYSLADPKPLPQAYYRLRSLDFDGKEQVSNAVFLRRETTRLEILNAFPSPAKERLSVQVAAPEEGDLTLRLLDMNGRIVYEKEYAVSRGLNMLQAGPGALPTGVYVLTVTDGVAKPAVRRVVFR